MATHKIVRKLPARVPAVLADELIEALRSCRRLSGVKGDALIDVLQHYRAGGFYIHDPVRPRRPSDGLSLRPSDGLSGSPINAMLYIALRDLDRAFAKLHALRAGGVAAWAFKPLAEYPAIVRFVQAANKGLPKARDVRAKKRKKKAVFDHTEWRTIAHAKWCASIKLSRHTVAMLVREELARRRPDVPADELPKVPTIVDAIKGVKATVTTSKGRAASTIYDEHIRK